MREIQKLCKICLNQGSRDIFDAGFTNIVQNRDEIHRIAEKLRYVTLLKVNPKENLPHQICDLCIVQLNVSYNFKRLALKNDFHIRQYMIENGMSLTKDDDDNNGNIETALEIHQIHNVIRTSSNHVNFRAAPAISSSVTNELRRNSTTSSVSGVSAMILNGCDTNLPSTNGNTTDSNFAHPTSRPFLVRPIQIKTEPVDPEYEVNGGENHVSITQSSPTSSSSGSLSVLTVHSSEPLLPTPPMIVINGKLEKLSPKKSTKPIETTTTILPPSKTKTSKKITRDQENENDKPRNSIRNLRTIKKTNGYENKRKLREAVKKVLDKRNQLKVQKETILKKKKMQEKIKSKVKQQKNKVQKAKLGRPKKK